MDIRFGIVSDSQYSDIEDQKGRQYRGALTKLETAITKFNAEDLDFVIQLGDMIDHDYESYKPVMRVWNKLKHRSYHVLGNHDFCVSDEYKDRILTTLGMTSLYYSFQLSLNRFIVLNGNGLSFNAFKKNSSELEFSKEYWEKESGGSEWWNGAVDKDQLTWLKLELAKAESLGQKVFIFCHYPLIGEDRYVLWNNKELLEIVEAAPQVKVWMNGHFHEGNYVKNSSVHHVNMKGMVQFETPSFAICELSEEYAAITGYGAEESRILKI